MPAKPNIITTFERVEKKSLISVDTALKLTRLIESHIQLDHYGEYTICNLYYDTEQYDLIRRSMDKPPYKEKMRLRSYGRAGPEDVVFLELKKKYEGRVYKRRISFTLAEAVDYLFHGIRPSRDGQVLHELDYFIQWYHPEPKVFLAYDRTAYQGRNNSDLRITFDRNIRYRTDCLTLSQDGGQSILDEDKVLMEIKVQNAYPLWLAHALSDLRIYPTSFSKYGRTYTQITSSQRSNELCSPALLTPQQAVCR